jgi:hypothetical protein
MGEIHVREDLGPRVETFAIIPGKPVQVGDNTPHNIYLLAMSHYLIIESHQLVITFIGNLTQLFTNSKD